MRMLVLPADCLQCALGGGGFGWCSESGGDLCHCPVNSTSSADDGSGVVERCQGGAARAGQLYLQLSCHYQPGQPPPSTAAIVRTRLTVSCLRRQGTKRADCCGFGRWFIVGSSAIIPHTKGQTDFDGATVLLCQSIRSVVLPYQPGHARSGPTQGEAFRVQPCTTRDSDSRRDSSRV